MGTSFVTLGRGLDGAPAAQGSQFGFWMHDSDLELLLRLMALHVAVGGSPESGDRAERIRDQWLMASGEGFVGSVPHGFEELSVTPDALDIARKALGSLLVALDQAPPTLPGAIFSLLGLGSPASRDLSVQGIRRAVEAFDDLFEGRVKSTSRDRTFVSIVQQGA